jgi:GntR family transcriptional regulator
MIDPATLPLYAQLKAAIIDSIRNGTLKPGARIASQRDLSEQFSMSHMTVRRALNELLNAGVIYTIPGKGMYVSGEKVEAESSPFVSFTEEMQRRGLQSSSKLIEADIVVANMVLAQIFKVGIGTRLYVLHRLRLADGEPIALQKAYLPYARFPDFLKHNFSVESLYTVLRQKYGVIFASSTYAVEAALAEEWEAKHLKLSLPAALLITEQVTQEQGGTVIEHVRSAYRGDRYKMQSEKGS